MTFEEFKKKYSHYEFRFDANAYVHQNDLKYKIYDKYSPTIIDVNLDRGEAYCIASLMNIEDGKYLKRVYNWLYPSNNIYGLHDD